MVGDPGGEPFVFPAAPDRCFRHAGTAQRYPGLNMTPWRQVLRGEA
jgi:hypothetical protein